MAIEPLMRGRQPERSRMMFSPRLLRERMTAAAVTEQQLDLLVRKRHDLAFTSADMLSGRSRPGPEALFALADVLGCAMEDFLEARSGLSIE